MILVTGATGHIGNVLVRKLLDQGEKVRALVWRGEDTTPLKDLEVEQVVGDVLDPASLEPAMRGVESVFHLAGIISIMPGKNPFVWKAVIAPYRQYQDHFAKLIEKGIAEGSLKPTDSQVAAQVIVSMAVGLVLQGVLDPHGANWEKTACESMRILMNGLAT